MVRSTLRLGGLQSRVDALLSAWDSARFGARLWEKDPTLWSDRPALEISDRLGWLELPLSSAESLGELESLAREVAAEGARHVVLLGMGGSSLAPEVFQSTLGNAAGHPELVVLDSTHPDAVRAVSARVDAARALFLVSSKSGTTLETLSFFRHFWERAAREVGGTRGSGAAGSRFVAITDPGTPLERLARDRGFRRVVSARSDLGGRYSALSAFGIVPAALIGADARRLLAAAQRMAEACGPSRPAAESPGLVLGATLGELALARRDKLTLTTSSALASLPAWIEQLIAESTGKNGKGIVPVVDEPLAAPDAYRDDRAFVSITRAGERDAEQESRLAALEAAGHPVVRTILEEESELGAEMFRWEVATAAAGAALGIHPFDQPDVELAKDLARRAMKGEGAGAGSAAQAAVGIVPASDPSALSQAAGEWLASARAGDYVAIHAYLAPDPATTVALQSIRLALRDRLRAATTVGYGPRFLHSTGQLHKGGPNSALVLQIVDAPRADLAVPESDFTFGALVRAQAEGDAQALAQRARRVLRVDLGADAPGGLGSLARALFV